jgi:hypothetical protein
MKISNLLKVLLFSCVILLSCEEDIGTRETETPMFDVSDPEFDKYLNEYKRLAQQKGITFKNKELTINFVDGFKKQQGSVIGICEYFSDNRVEILIKKPYYEDASERTKEALMYHELTHCMCFRDHEYKGYMYKKGTESPEDTMFRDGCPKTLIFPTILTTYCSEEHWDHYLDEMFDNCPGADKKAE